ncbi:prenyltransferase/squalene oxidase repeat-containing protein [Carboxylicivirga sp. M1479]|uniref:prenyltransferase/squalene oxidase repeat-containing protein n=1 Tax=Carboxylicivirga sp. M1479 TaxID=2594476 RepID=UPI0011782DDF|nr:prenyltransferase/squalene oxidase repeat-containing protein [Carboxylicivirga sp. M1479]TRX70619.1 squalene--hopene cyclase [Carboxylicivirga sp. M1479]
MQNDKVNETIEYVSRELMKRRPKNGDIWTGLLSSSAISTSVALFALYMFDKKSHQAIIEKAGEWLKGTMLPDGTWGDSIESPSNMTATLLSYAALNAIGQAPEETKDYLKQRFNGIRDQHIITGVLKYYGKDLTFSAPILVMCALSGLITSWKNIPQLPFEVSVFPQKLFRFFKLPVVSYAIPALIAVGILRYKKGGRNKLRELFIPASLKVLQKLQPSNGGFLEAAPLTGFVTMCMCGAGYSSHVSVKNAVSFLSDTVREDGSWPIDTNLAAWVTSLSVKALDGNLEDGEHIADLIKSNAFNFQHPFTGARQGGWGWTNLPGSVPDADDTAGALVALHKLDKGVVSREVIKGIEWLLHLQNSNGGIPTFCKGWGKLPFDRSSPDITAHTLFALQLWRDKLSDELRKKCDDRMLRMLKWMQIEQADNGCWYPLWFGDQDAEDERAPVYGTAISVEYLADIEHPIAKNMLAKGVAYLISTQNEDGGWGGAIGLPSKLTFTARALSALSGIGNIEHAILNKAFDYIFIKIKQNELLKPEPIGLYFSRLWYSEEMYNITFVLTALSQYKKKITNAN